MSRKKQRLDQIIGQAVAQLKDEMDTEDCIDSIDYEEEMNAVRYKRAKRAYKHQYAY